MLRPSLQLLARFKPANPFRNRLGNFTQAWSRQHVLGWAIIRMQHMSVIVIAAVVMSKENSVEETFSKYLADKFPNAAKRGISGVINSAFGDRIKCCLNDPGLPEEKTWHFFVKKHGFKLLNVPSLGMKDVLVAPVKDEKEVCSFLFKRLSNVFMHTYISQHKRISQKITVFLGSVIRWCL